MRGEVPGTPSAVTPNAATLAATYPTRSGARVILIRRPETMRRHPGQIAFPGGMIEPTDSDPLSAALREAYEELGLRVPPSSQTVPLAPVATLSTGVVIQPFWVHLSASPRLRPRREEVAAVLRVPIQALRGPGTLSSVPHPRRPGTQVPAYCWRSEVIWGATFQSLVELLDLLSVFGIN